MDFWIRAAQLLLSLSFLIVLHEFGHYLPARLFKTRVEKFYLFFDYKFSLVKKKIKETEWGIGWIPLGGYVKIAGMIDESMDTEQMAQEPQPWEFRTKPAWQRLIIMIGGIVVNFILGIIIYAMVIWAWGKDYVPVNGAPYGMEVHEEFEKLGFEDGDQILQLDGEEPFDVTRANKDIFLRGTRDITVQHPNGDVETITLAEDINDMMFEKDAIQAFQLRFKPYVDTLYEDMPAIDSELKEGDLITSLNGDTVEWFHEFATQVNEFKDTNITIGYLRDGVWASTVLKTNEEGQIGFKSVNEVRAAIKHKDYGFFSSIPEGWNMAIWTIHDYAAQLQYIFTEKGAKSMGGFGAFGKMFPTTWDWQSFWLNTALISLILAFMNFLPIPALDGGHIMFLLWEIITRRKPSDKFLQYAQVVGFVLLLSLLLYANGNDIYKAIWGE